MGKYFGVIIMILVAACTPLSDADPIDTGETSLMSSSVSGTFVVRQGPTNDPPESISDVNRVSLLKEFHGGLDAVSRLEMLSALTGENSGGYVAIERVVGVLDGRRGSFLLQHHGTMQGTSQRLLITVVPQSGTEELQGIEGTMSIEVENGTHSYDFDYSMPSHTPRHLFREP